MCVIQLASMEALVLPLYHLKVVCVRVCGMEGLDKCKCKVSNVGKQSVVF